MKESTFQKKMNSFAKSAGAKPPVALVAKRPAILDQGDPKKIAPSVATKLKNGVINTTANILSAPAQIKAKRSMNKSSYQANILRTARAYDNAPDRNNDGTVSDAFKARSLAKDVRRDMNFKNLPPQAKKTVAKGIRKGNVKFEDNKYGGEFIYTPKK